MDIPALLLALKKLGLTQYEANCYVQLVMLGPSDPRKIATKARMPYPNAYESLKRLEDRGWVELIRRRPATYIAKKPDLIKHDIISEVSKTFDKLESVYRTVPSEETELVFTIRDRRKVVNKVYELLSEAKEEVIVVGPAISFLEADLANALDKITKKGIRVRVISDNEIISSLPERIEARIGMLFAFDLLVDKRIAMIALPDLSACGWADSDAVAKHFLQFLELMWSTSRGGD